MQSYLKFFICLNTGLLSILFLNACQQTDDYIATIDSHLGSYVKCEDEILGFIRNYTSEISYYDNENLVKIVTISHREDGKYEKNIYLKDNGVIYTKELNSTYEIKEKDGEVYSDISSITSVVSSQLYFKNQKLIAWIENGKTIDQKSKKYLSRVEQWLDEYRNLNIDELIKRKGCKKESEEEKQKRLMMIPVSQYHSAEVDKCLALQKTKPTDEFGYVDGEFNEGVKTGWYPSKSIKAETNVYDSFRRWAGKELQDVYFETSTPSGDWFRTDKYCFRRDNSIAGLYSDFRTFYGDVQVIRIWLYNKDGSVANTGIEIVDLKTKEPVKGNIVETDIDRPPYLVKNYEELLKKLKLLVEE